MDIGLFDLYTTGHHLPYAARTKRAIEAVSDHDVTFVTVSETDQSSRLFDRSDIIYLDDRKSPPIEERRGNFDDIADRKVEDFFTDETASRFDVVQFLYSDDTLGSLWRHSSFSEGPRLVGEINGGFFRRGTLLRRPYTHPIFLNLLSSPARRVIDAAVPDNSKHKQLWRDLYLYRCLDQGSFDYIITHSKEAEEYVSRVDTRETTQTRMIPYPVPEEFGTAITKEQARKELELPLEDSILLFFGTLRNEKGIDPLLRALRRYNGPSFTMVIAGPPVTVTEEDVLAVKNHSQVDIITKLEYIDEPERYYRAADAMILPYLRQFGKECTSQSMEEACSSLLPVIVPDFGAIGRMTEEEDLGITYEQGSDEALIETLSRFARGEVSYSVENMKQRNRRHSHQRAAEQLVDIYETIIK